MLLTPCGFDKMTGRRKQGISVTLTKLLNNRTSGYRRSGCRPARIDPAEGRDLGGRRVRGDERDPGSWQRSADRGIRNLRLQEPSGPSGAQPGDRRELVDAGLDSACLQAEQGAQECRERKVTTRAGQERGSGTNEDKEGRDVEKRRLRDDEGRRRLILALMKETSWNSGLAVIFGVCASEFSNLAETACDRRRSRNFSPRCCHRQSLILIDARLLPRSSLYTLAIAEFC